MEQVEKFIENWTLDSNGMKTVFQKFYQDLGHQEGVALEFNERPGVSYSLRASHVNQKERPLFVLIDAIDDDPAERWLSVCFYGDMIQDPDELGDLIPEGLLGNDGYCFDIDSADAELTTYVATRIQEACAKAAEA